jgi:hypothetical protein
MAERLFLNAHRGSALRTIYIQLSRGPKTLVGCVFQGYSALHSP